MDGIDVIEDHPEASSVALAVRKAVERAASGECAGIESLSVILTGHEMVRELNVTYLEHDYDTDVLAFDLGDPDSPGIEGEVYVDLDTAIEYCSEHGESLEREAARYAVHGTLHLIGYMDDTADGKRAMREREDRYVL